MHHYSAESTSWDLQWYIVLLCQSDMLWIKHRGEAAARKVFIFQTRLCVRKWSCILNMKPLPKPAPLSQSTPYYPAWFSALLPNKRDFHWMSSCSYMWCVSVKQLYLKKKTLGGIKGRKEVTVCISVKAMMYHLLVVSVALLHKMTWPIRDQCVCMH